MKIVAVDNFNRESVADSLVAENISSFYAKTIVDALQAKFGGEQSGRFYVIKDDDYLLWRGMDELV